MTNDPVLVLAANRRRISVSVVDGDGTIADLGREEGGPVDEVVTAVRRGDLGALRRRLSLGIRTAHERDLAPARAVIMVGPGLRDAAASLVGDRVEGLEIVDVIDESTAVVAAVALARPEMNEPYLVVDTDHTVVMDVSPSADGARVTNRAARTGSVSGEELGAALADVLAMVDATTPAGMVVLFGAAASDPDLAERCRGHGLEVVVERSVEAVSGAAAMSRGLVVADDTGGAATVVGPNAWDFAGAPTSGGLEDRPTVLPEESDRPTALADDDNRPTVESDRPTAETDRPTVETDRPTTEAAPGVDGGAGAATPSVVPPHPRADEPSTSPGPGSAIPMRVGLIGIGVVAVAGVAALAVLGGIEQVLPAAACSGASGERGPAPAPSAPPRAMTTVDERWNVALGAPSAVAPVVFGNLAVAVTAGSDEQPAVVHAVDLAAGTEAWRHELDGRVFSPMFVDTASTEPLVWVADDAGVLVALDATGAVVASCDVPTPVRTMLVLTDPEAPPLLHVGTSGGVVRAIDPRSGTQVWATRLPEAVRALVEDDTGIVAVGVDGHITILAPSSGRVLAERAGDGSVSTAPVVTADGLVLAGDDGTVRLRSVSGEVVWTTVLDSPVRAPVAVLDDVLWVPTVAGNLTLLDVGTGATRTVVPLGATADGGAVAFVNGVASADDSGLVVIHHPDTDEPLATIELDGAVNGGFTAEPDGLLVVDSSGAFRRLVLG